MILRSLAVWFAILVTAFINGTVRTLWFIPSLGDSPAHILSTILLLLLVLVISWLTIRWIHPATSGEAIVIGVFWVLLTVGFEFLAGHYLFGGSWEKLLADYNVFNGRIWPLVLVVAAIAPLWMAHMRGLFGSTQQ